MKTEEAKKILKELFKSNMNDSYYLKGNKVYGKKTKMVRYDIETEMTYTPIQTFTGVEVIKKQIKRKNFVDAFKITIEKLENEEK